MLNSFPSEESYNDIDHQADILLAVLADYRTNWQCRWLPPSTARACRHKAGGLLLAGLAFGIDVRQPAAIGL